MNRKLAAAILACTLGMGVGSAKAALPVDGVKVLVPNETEVDFFQFDDSTGSPETFVGSTALPIGFIEGTVFLTEPDTGEFSDALTILLNSTGGINIFFFSDPLEPLPANISPHQMSIPETGQWQDVSAFFGQAPGFAQVISDVDPTPRTGVPEPTPWAMMIAGFAFAGAMLRGERRRVRAG